MGRNGISAPLTLDENAVAVEAIKGKCQIRRLFQYHSRLFVFHHLTASLSTLPPSATNVLKHLKPLWSNHTPHSTYSLAVIVVGALWDSCRIIVLLIDGKKLIKQKLFWANC